MTKNVSQRGTIIAERNLYKSYPLTEKIVDDAVQAGALKPIRSVSGGRFFTVVEVEEYVDSLNSKKAKA